MSTPLPLQTRLGAAARFAANTAMHAVAVERRPRYRPEDFTYIANVVDDPGGFWVRADSPLRTQLLALAERDGVKIDVAKLQSLLGVPVVRTRATRKAGRDELIARIDEVLKTMTPVTSVAVRRARGKGEPSPRTPAIRKNFSAASHLCRTRPIPRAIRRSRSSVATWPRNPTVAAATASSGFSTSARIAPCCST